MASVTLDRIWIQDPAVPDAGLPLLRKGGRTFERDISGEVRRYATGILRSVSTVGYAFGAEFTASVNREELERLFTFQGKTILYRDGLGHKVFGVFYRVPYVPSNDGQEYTVNLKIKAVTYFENV